MSEQLKDLAAVLEETIAVGEELRRNLQAQEQAILEWDSAGLLERIEVRERWLRQLGALERRRREIVRSLCAEDRSVTLRGLLQSWPHDAPERQRLGALRERSRQIFLGLQAEERSVFGVMENLSAHIQDALSPLSQGCVPLYGQSGAAEAQARPAALIQNKA